MIVEDRRFAAIWLAVVVVTIVALSLLFDVPYIYSAIGIASLVFVGHLVTIDDDYAGGWSNPEGKQSIWNRSLYALAAKLSVLLLLGLAVLFFPGLRSLGG